MVEDSDRAWIKSGHSQLKMHCGQTQGLQLAECEDDDYNQNSHDLRT
jgi:hypothetical protein